MKVLALAVVAMLAVPAHADDATKLKKDGLKAAQAKNWTLARDKFAQSYALEPRPLTLYNLAAAQEHTGQLVTARAGYAKFLADTKPGADDQFRAAAQDAIAALDRAIPTLRIKPVGFATGVTYEVDGKAAGAATPIAVDPGAHTIAARSGADVLAKREITIVTGARDDIELVAPIPKLVVPPPDKQGVITTQPPKPHRSLLQSKWFWGVTSAIVVGVAGASYFAFYYGGAPATRGTFGTVNL